ncbi:DUF5677 domain-containing protein [Streptomyces canus]|uniref:DUF5677 domain-containing protein n=1 Tax=Streptomyces canus TaxID=58343 RepID=UPI00224D0441|nr:DUF5677 domain-containing protein [Streptomyces canus]MCX4861228.1 DUF5677 domain-containing protein [Streptomyces canus]WSW33616.1 DUF5677 domain-containing protein [Streptomyces canus]
MAQSRKQKKDQRGRSGAQVSGNPQVRSLLSPKVRLKPLFKLFNDVTGTADRLVYGTPLHSDQQLVRFDAEVLVRGINSLKAARILMEQGHWEHAVGVTRQLFELLINMEHLGTMEDREAATLLYLRFGALQVALGHRRDIEYNQQKGRPIDAHRLAFLEKVLDTQFSDFKGRPKHDGTETWVPSWSKKNAKTLAELSPSKMRMHQYQYLYAAWSEQAHATPSSLIDNVFREAGDGWVDEVIESDDKKIIETSAMALVLFLELWDALPYAPPMPKGKSTEWAEQMKKIIAMPDLFE